MNILLPMVVYLPIVSYIVAEMKQVKTLELGLLLPPLAPPGAGWGAGQLCNCCGNGFSFVSREPAEVKRLILVRPWLREVDFRRSNAAQAALGDLVRNESLDVNFVKETSWVRVRQRYISRGGYMPRITMGEGYW